MDVVNQTVETAESSWPHGSTPALPPEVEAAVEPATFKAGCCC